jgi:hypothetical protein
MLPTPKIQMIHGYGSRMPGADRPLRVSNVVYGRTRRGNRVYYLLDHKGEGGAAGVPESVILHRWRRRRKDGYTFSGARLAPNLWRTFSQVFPGEPSTWMSLTLEEIQSRVRECREAGLILPRALPNARVLQALLLVCGAERIAQLIKRHTDSARSDRFGTPDLFLFATDACEGRPTMARFVEVKKPEEPVSRDQREEIEYLRSLGLQARVLRLKEQS